LPYLGAKYFDENFNPKKLRDLSGSIGQQLVVTECILKLAIYFAKFFKVYSVAYDGLGTEIVARYLSLLFQRPAPKLYINPSLSG
jgi:hypothetical protein